MPESGVTNETAFNTELRQVLQGKHPLWRRFATAEQRRVFKNARRQPDIVIRHPLGQPVVLENEYFPARTVEEDAKNRLGEELVDSSETLNQAFALRTPAELKFGQENLQERIQKATFEYCLFSKIGGKVHRWPEQGWLAGNIDTLARSLEHALLSEQVIAKGTNILEGAVTAAVQLIEEKESGGFTDPGAAMARQLHQQPGEQTLCLAMAILANALVFHTAIEGAGGVPAMNTMRLTGHDSFYDKHKVIECWSHIIREINYWPIFKIAIDILDPIPEGLAQRVLGRLADEARRLANVGVTTMHDLTGRMFQSLIADRKFLATFYTLPTSAALLAELSAPRVPIDWSDAEEYLKVKVADLACGTGTLLSAAYQALLARYRRTGNDDQNIHAVMLEDNLVALDIMPAATHLAASQLSSAHPAVTFGDTKIFTMPYGLEADGAQEGQGLSIGSLDFLDTNQAMPIFATGQQQVHGAGRPRTPEHREANIPHNSIDWVIMNPPFTRPTNHALTDIPIPSFAGFNTPEDEQREMKKRLSKMLRDMNRARTGDPQRPAPPASHGNAGLASNFFDLADVKVKVGGVIALVMPLSFVSGASWASARRLLTSQYKDITIVSLTATGATTYAFSADTDMGEILLVATRTPCNQGSNQTLFVNLYGRPRTLMEASEIASLVNNISKESTSGELTFGESPAGNYVRMLLGEGGGGVGLLNVSLARTMRGLGVGAFRTPRLADSYEVPTTHLGQLGYRGLVHRDINGLTQGRPRGPFDMGPIVGIPDYPTLWTHNASRERRFFVEPDCQGNIRPGCATQAARVWRTATRLHFTLDFRLTSQSLAACLTPSPTLGGRAWPNFILSDPKWEVPLVLWTNSTLGLMARWWIGSRQQQGRATLTLSRLPDLWVIDPRQLSEEQIRKSSQIFERLKEETFLPANEAYRDPTRQELDHFVLSEMLSLPDEAIKPFAHLRLQWCAEPSVHGGKSTALSLQ